MFTSSRNDQPLTPASHFNPKVSFLPKFEPKKPRVIISRQAYAQMNLYVEIAKQEVGWMGTVKRLDNGDFFIEKCFLFRQNVHETETEISNEGFSELSMELLDGAVEENEAEWDVNKLRFWGHSHVYMGTSPSITDEQTMLSNYGTGRSSNTGQSRFCFEDSGYPWVIRGIFNKLGEANFSIYLYEEGYRFDNIEWTVEEPSAEQIAFHKAEDERARQAARYSAPAYRSPRTEPKPESKPEGEAEIVASKDEGTEKGDKGEKVTAIDASKTEPADEASNEKSSPAGRSSYDRSHGPESRSGGFFGMARPFFERPRDMKYRPDITPELRAAVEEDFNKKVQSRSSWWNRPSRFQTERYDRRQEEPRTSSYEDAPLDAAEAERNEGLHRMAETRICEAQNDLPSFGALMAEKNAGTRSGSSSAAPENRSVPTVERQPSGDARSSFERDRAIARARDKVDPVGETDDRRAPGSSSRKPSEGPGLANTTGSWLLGKLKDALKG